MSDKKLYIVLMGLPARGKSTLAIRLRDYFLKEGIATRIFNNGNLRRLYLPHLETSSADFYSPENETAVALRKKFARMNMDRARKYLFNNGMIAILDATNAGRERRGLIEKTLNDHDLLFIECVNDDDDILKMSIQEKIRLPEFAYLEGPRRPRECFKKDRLLQKRSTCL